MKGVIFDLKGTIPIDVPLGYVNMTGSGIIHLDSYTDDFAMKVIYKQHKACYERQRFLFPQQTLTRQLINCICGDVSGK